MDIKDYEGCTVCGEFTYQAGSLQLGDPLIDPLMLAKKGSSLCSNCYTHLSQSWTPVKGVIPISIGDFPSLVTYFAFQAILLNYGERYGYLQDWKETAQRALDIDDFKLAFRIRITSDWYRRFIGLRSIKATEVDWVALAVAFYRMTGKPLHPETVTLKYNFIRETSRTGKPTCDRLVLSTDTDHYNRYVRDILAIRGTESLWEGQYAIAPHEAYDAAAGLAHLSRHDRDPHVDTFVEVGCARWTDGLDRFHYPSENI